VVAGAKTRGAERNAALRQAAIFPRVCERTVEARRGSGGSSSLRFRSERRNPTVGWIGNQRRAIVEFSLDEPEMIVVARAAVDGGERFRARQRGFEDAVTERGVATTAEKLRRSGLHCVKLRRRQLRLASQRGRPLQRCGNIVPPNALQIGLAVDGSGNLPRDTLRRSCFARCLRQGRRCYPRRRAGTEQRHCSDEYDMSQAHVKLLASHLTAS